MQSLSTYLLSPMEVLVNMTSTIDFVPLRTMEIELARPLPIISAFDDRTQRYYQRASCLVRLHTQPLGVIEIQLEQNEVHPHEYAERIWCNLHAQINAHLAQDGLPAVTELNAYGLTSSAMPHCIEERERFLASAPFVSVIIPTHDRPDRLALCLKSLMALHYPQYEVIVVDNAPSTNATADLVQSLSESVPSLHYVREDRPGPSWARNRGIMVAKGAILAFADDDVVVDPYWLVELVRSFSLADDVGCVTGLVLPLEIETHAQFLFEQYGGFNKGYTSRIFKRHMGKCSPPMPPLYPYTAGRFGTGASMAFSAAALRDIGGFDTALGGNGPSRNGQDIAVFFQIVMHGHKLVYQPKSVTHHLHRRTYAELYKQIYNYGIGLTAFLTKTALDNPLLLFDIISRIPYGLFFILSSRSTKNSKKLLDYPKELTALEHKGMLYGPFAYVRSRLQIRKIRRRPAVDDAHTTMAVTRNS